MTHSFWGKYLTKKMTAVLLLFIVVSVIFLFRRPIAIKSIEHLTKPYDISVSCLDFSFNWRLSLNLKQACITSPFGTAEVNNATWQLWSNALIIERVKVKHRKQDAAGNKEGNETSIEQQKNGLNLPGSLPKLHISSFEINSFKLLQPLSFGVSTISSNELEFTGDVDATVKIFSDNLVGNITWRMSDLTRWIPQAQALFQENTELLKELAFDETEINTRLTFDGQMLKVSNNLDIVSNFHVSTCSIDTAIKGNIFVAVNVDDLEISLDLTQLSNNISVVNCSLLQDYFAPDDLPQLSLTFPQKITIDKTHINLPKLKIVDKVNIHRSIILNEVNYKATGELEVGYNISFKQPIKIKKIVADMFDLQAQGTLSTILSAQSLALPMSFKIINDNSQLVIENLKTDSLLISDLSSEFSFYNSRGKQLEIKGTVNSSAIQIGVVNIEQMTSDFYFSGASFNDLQLSADNQFFKLTFPEVNVQRIANHMDLNIKGLKTLSFNGNSTVTASSAKNIDFLPINASHIGKASLVNMTLSSQHKVVLENAFLIELTQQQAEVKIQVKQQDIISLQRIISQLENTLLFEEGNFSANIELFLPQDSEQFVAKGKADFQYLSAKYQNYTFKNLSYQTPLEFDSAGLQLARATLHIDLIDAGVMIRQLDANVIAQDSRFRLEQVQGEIFNGQFLLDDLWLDDREQQFNIEIQNIDLSRVVGLQEQPGINITGDIDGNMPFIMGKQGVRMDNGQVSSLTGGKLSIINNPSFDSIKDQQPELALLENFDFTQLKSSVKFTPDGWVFLDLALHGKNPDKKQNVNFNYSHQENIFALLESIRLVKSVENKIEQKITQGDKK
jgi:hypothetical protein